MEIWPNDAEDILRELKEGNRNFGNILVVLSGGMDSATVLAIANAIKTRHNIKVTGITFDYGQTHDKELILARELGWHYEIDVKTIDLSQLAKNFRTALKKDSDIAIPDGAVEGAIPPTYVPFRNTIMLSVAFGYAESWGYDHIMFGANQVDYSGYPDCRPAFVDAINMVAYAHNVKIAVEAPIIDLKKSEIVKLGTALGVPWDKTWSCYRGESNACGKCPSCEYRLQGFSEAGVQDPIVYATEEQNETS